MRASPGRSVSRTTFAFPLSSMPRTRAYSSFDREIHVERDHDVEVQRGRAGRNRRDQLPALGLEASGGDVTLRGAPAEPPAPMTPTDSLRKDGPTLSLRSA